MACAHANPALVPARIGRPGTIVADVGGAYVAPVAEPVLTAGRVADERVRAGNAPTDDERAAIVRAASAFGATSTGPASYLAVRGALGQRVELQGALINLRTARFGARRAFGFGPEDKWAFAMGLAARAGVDVASYRAAGGAELRGGEVFGGDFNAQIGRTSNELYDVWAGARLGYTYGGARLFHPAFVGSIGDAAGVLSARVHRVELSFNVGLRVGFGRFAAVVELDTAMAFFWANADTTTVRIDGVALSLVPSTALAITF
ncbi:MAG: hypothetical protein JNK05_33380 [Myxococcales bacterium]|nr:hypothetical protein [Myxococcales bacterium]